MSVILTQQRKDKVELNEMNRKDEQLHRNFGVMKSRYSFKF